MFDTPEAKAALQEKIDEALAPLVKKNRELLDELKQARKGKEVDPAKVEELENRIEALSSELSTAQKDLKAAKKDAETAQKALDTETAFNQKLLIDNGLTGELTRNGVTNPGHLKAAQALLRQGVQVVIDGENRVVKVGDKTLESHVKDWAASDEGKLFVTAPGSSGGGAQGGTGSAGKVDLSKLPPAARLAAAREQQAAGK